MKNNGILFIVVELLIIVAATALYVLPPLIATQGMSVRLDSDYSAHIPMLQYVSDYIRSHNSIPMLNPYAGTGIPTIGDPLSSTLNPFLMIPLVALGVDLGLRIYFIIVMLIAGITMWMFLTSIGVRIMVRVWGAVLYLTSGTGAAIIAAGHIEKLLAFSLFPLFFLFSFRHPMKTSDKIGAGIVLTLMFFSGGLYSVWYGLLLFMTARIYYAVMYMEDRKRALSDGVFTLIICLVLSFPKLYDYITRVDPILYRIIPAYALGSIHIFLTPLQFIMPFQVAFYDRPFFQRLLGFHYNWYEYYAFISPLPFIFLLRTHLVKNKAILLLCVLMFLIAAFHIALKYTYSPFYWVYALIPPAQIFRVPQRIILPATSIVLAFIAMPASAWWTTEKDRKSRLFLLALFLGSIIWTLTISQRTVYAVFRPEYTEGKQIAVTLRQIDSSSYYVGITVCCLQSFFVEENIPVFNYYYGWKTKESAGFRYVNQGNSIVLSESAARPKYIISDRDALISEHYIILIQTESYTIWVTDSPTVTP